jgi:uncharacterized protein
MYNKDGKQLPLYYFSYLALVLSCWAYYMYSNQLFHLLAQQKSVIATMIFGAFVAGSSPEGSAAIAYPVFTLLLDIDPSTTRNFAFAIQSLGMTAASILILNLKIKVDWSYIRYVVTTGVVGLIIGTLYVVPYISPPLAKLFFVSLWFSFGIVLWQVNRQKDRTTFDQIQNFSTADKYKLMAFGLVGGIISSIFGTGINIFTYCFMVIYYKVSEKVATPSSVIIMTIETLIGFGFHYFWIKDFNMDSHHMWVSCIPFVIVMAPLGAYIISKIHRLTVARMLYAILLVQYFGALWVLQPSLMFMFYSSITICIGLALFYWLSRQTKK